MLILVSTESLVAPVPKRQQNSDHHNQLIRNTKSGFVSILAASTILLSPGADIVFALDEEALVVAVVDTVTQTEVTSPTKKASYSIIQCDASSKSPCVSTSNVRQLNLYVPPWTFRDNVNTDEIMARLKGSIESDPLSTVVSQDSNIRLLVDSKRKNDLISGTVDRLEFVINKSDGVVTFRSSAPSESTFTDFGYQRKRIEEIRERAGIFGVMGDTLNTADTKTVGERGGGPLGQLKSFYGLQSGGGFEDVLAE